MSDKPWFLRKRPEPNGRERWAMRELTRQRAESILVMDRNIGRLIRRLKKTREWSDTVFVFTSDNGYFLGEHRQRQGKMHGHEPSMRVPMLVTGPGMRGRNKHGRKRYDPITNVDLTATILDLANAAPPMPGDGVTRLPTIRDGDQGWTVPVLHEALGSGGRKGGAFDDARTSIGVRTARYSMLLHRNGAELYDLARDPYQNRNVWKSPRYRPVRRALRGVLKKLTDCRAATCQRVLPARFRATPRTNRALTRGYWRAIDRRYGW